MTHSHDTSTPAMSAETVPSEEFVLVPREPTPAMVDAGRIYGWDDPEHEASCIGHPETRESIYRAMIAAAPALSDRPPAKEVDGKAVVPYDDFHAAYQFVPRSKMSPDHCLKTRLRSLLREEDLAHVDEAEVLASPTLSASHLAKEGGEAGAGAGAGELRKFAESFKFTVTDSFYSDAYLTINEPDSANFRLGTGSQFSKFIAALEARRVAALASLPQPSPALAKGGDAVREALRKIATMPWRSNSTVEMQSIARAALSTPTEGPASQTEGMGGDAGKIMYVCAGCEDSNPENCGRTDRHDLGVAPDGRWLCEDCWSDAGLPDKAPCPPEYRPAAAALTPRDTAEAVPVAGEPAESGTIFPKLEDTARLREELERIITDTESKDAADLKDMANVGHTIMSALKRLGRSYSNSPEEVLFDLENELFDAKRERDDAVKALETAREDERDRLFQAWMDRVPPAHGVTWFDVLCWFRDEQACMQPPDRAAARSASSQGGE